MSSGQGNAKSMCSINLKIFVVKNIDDGSYDHYHNIIIKMHVHCAIKNLIFIYYKYHYLLQLHLISRAPMLVQGSSVP